MSDKMQQCYWEDEHLVIVTDETRLELSSSDGIRALKTNSWPVPGSSGSTQQPLFDPDDPRRMTLIQEKISSIRD